MFECAISFQKKVVMISVMMQSSNQKCNALGSVFGIFLHSTNTPEKVIQALAHMGISISINAIHSAIHSLSKETFHTLRAMGRSLLVTYAYDNFDIDFKRSVPTVEKSRDTLEHLTSGDLIMLEHGVTVDDLKCSEYLWKKSPLNPDIDPGKLPVHTCADLLSLHPEINHPSGLTRCERFNAWKFRYDLCHYGPVYFRQFIKDLGLPKVVEQIPVVKMRHAPARSMDINQSKVSGNIRVIPELLRQGGVGDPNDGNGTWQDDVIDVTKFVVLVFGDLGTSERVQSILLRHSLETSPWQRYQYVVFGMGLFHLKMACADAIWRIFIEPKAARDDVNSLMHFIALNRPKETGKIGSGPGFRQMHEVISHNGLALRLDCWRVEATKCNARWVSLDTFAQSKPSLQDIEAISNRLATSYVGGADNDIFESRCQPSASRDQQRENILLMHQYFLLYEEISYAMNAGDIGRVETLFPAWIYLFKATGKHKYAAQMIKFLTDVHFVYPEGLRHAIRYNMLVNPTGRPAAFRGVDWVVELLNLYTKSIFGGQGSNYTKWRVIEESVLVELYRCCHSNIERNFGLTSLTTRHAPPDLTKTVGKMQTYFDSHAPNQHTAGRKTAYSIPDMLNRGQGLVYGAAAGGADAEIASGEVHEFVLTGDDFSV
jgi:hypothetical protein